MEKSTKKFLSEFLGGMGLTALFLYLVNEMAKAYHGQ
jgi:hypothetical protein